MAMRSHMPNKSWCYPTETTTFCRESDSSTNPFKQNNDWSLLTRIFASSIKTGQCTHRESGISTTHRTTQQPAVAATILFRYCADRK